MQRKRLLSLALVFSILTGMLVAPVSATSDTIDLTPSSPSGDMTITLTIPNIPTAASVGRTSITLNAVSGCEYSMDGVNWQDIREFDNLTPGTVYTFYQRVKGTQNVSGAASISTEADTYEFTIILNIPAAPAAPTATDANITKTGITLTEVNGCEYSMDGENWQDSREFTNLMPGTAYMFYQRVKATDSAVASTNSPAATISTKADSYEFTITLNIPAAPAAPTVTDANITKTSITLNALTGCEYSMDGENWQDSREFTNLMPGTAYSFYQRVKATDSAVASASSPAATISTKTDTYAMTITLTIKEMTVVAENVSVAYDGQPHGITVTVSDPATGATVKYGTAEGTYNLDASPTQTAAGTLTVYYQVTADNYTTYTGSATVTVSNQPNASVTTAPTAKTGMTFNGGNQPLVTAGVASGGTMQYALGTESAPQGSYRENIPEGKAAQTYYVWYKAVGDEDHNDSEAMCVPVVIAQTSLTAQGVTIYAIPDQNSTGSQLTPKPVVKHLGYLLVDGEDYTLSYGENTAIGTGTGSLTLTGKGGYSGTLEKKFNIILPAYSGTLTVAAPVPYTYGAALGNRPSVTAKDKSTDADMSLSGERVTVYYATTPSGTGTAWSSSARLNAGTYYVWAELAATDTHDAATSERVQFIVNKATPAAPSGVLRVSYTDTYKVTLTIPSGKTYADYEYSTDGTNWKSLPALTGGAFTPDGLAVNATYTIYLRTKADSNNNASAAATATLKTPAKVLLSYDANGSTASVPAFTEYESGTTATVAAAISRAGYTFTGWKTGKDSGTDYAAGATFSITANTTLYAQWAANSYSVQYNANGGEGAISNDSFTYGTAAALSDGSGLLRSGYTFRGWATSASGNVMYRAGQSVSNLTTESNGTIALYAVWTQNTYVVSGTVMEELDGTTEQSIIADVAVTIVRGNVEFATTTTGDDGTYQFTGVPTGTYNIVATRTVDGKPQTMTALVDVSSDAKVDTIVLPPSRINSVLAVTGDSTPPVMVGGLEAVAKDEAVEDKEVTVTMTVEKKDESTASDEVKQQIEEIKEAVAAETSSGSGSTELEVLDVSVKKETTEGNNTTTETITETSQVIEIIVSFNMNGRFGFSLYRHHDGRAEPFQMRTSRFAKGSYADGWFFADKAAGLFYIYTSRFSTYAIGFEEGTGYTLTVNGGTGSGEFAAGVAVPIVAGAAPDGKVFDKWESSNGGTFANANAAETTFTMPRNDVTITASYRNRPESDSPTVPYRPGSGGSGSSASPAPTLTVPVSGDSGSVSVSATVSGTTANLSKANASDLERVIGSSVKTGEVVIDMTGLNREITAVTIPMETVRAIETAVRDTKNDASSLTVKATNGAVTFDARTLSAIAEQAKGSDIWLNLNKIDANRLRFAQQDALKGKDVQQSYDIYVTSNGTVISDFKGGTVILSLNYPLKSGQTADKLSVWYVSDDGKTLTELTADYDKNAVTFTVEHFSNYVIVYGAEAAKDAKQDSAVACQQDSTCPISKFTDAEAKAWYHDGVHYALEHGFMNGVGDGKFDPNGDTSRAMVVTMLWRLEGSPAYAGRIEYSDVDAEAWYAPALRWASAEGIVTGYDGRFAPNDAVTREQLAAMLWRYAKYKGADVSVGEDTNILSYNDAFDVSEYAIPAMQWAVGSAIINGYSENGVQTLAPQRASSRAVVATMFYRFCTGNQ